MEKENPPSPENEPPNSDEQSDVNFENGPIAFEEEKESAVSLINKLIWILFGILIVGIVIGSFRSAL